MCPACGVEMNCLFGAANTPRRGDSKGWNALYRRWLLQRRENHYWLSGRTGWSKKETAFIKERIGLVVRGSNKEKQL